MKALRYFRWEANAVVIAVVCALFVGVAVRKVSAVREDQREAQVWCAQAARVLIARKPVLAHTVRLADSCLYLRRLEGSEP